MSEDIIDVTELDFQYQVLEYSYQSPVVVDFWAEWCSPCKILTPILEKLAIEAQGGFRLAKINVDQNSNLAIRMGVHSIPHVKAIKTGQVVAEFVGIQPEGRIREFIKNIIPNPVDLWIEKGAHFYQIEDFQEATSAYLQALEIQPENTAAMLGLAKCYIRQNKFAQARDILKNIPASKEFTSAEIILPLVQTLVNYHDREEITDDFNEAAYRRGIRLIVKGNYYAALDGFLDILRQDKQFHHGQLKNLILGLLEVLGNENPETRYYRQELASILF
ncbi:MAG: tetratricopeptide repeat protein [Anaerolineales bacterium]